MCAPPGITIKGLKDKRIALHLVNGEGTVHGG